MVVNKYAKRIIGKLTQLEKDLFEVYRTVDKKWTIQVEFCILLVSARVLFCIILVSVHNFIRVLLRVIKYYSLEINFFPILSY